MTKAYDTEGDEILVSDFLACGVIAKMVNEILGKTILVLCRPNDGDSLHSKRSTSFIDLGIYNKDRAFRLALSSKITSPNRPFIPADNKTQ